MQSEPAAPAKKSPLPVVIAALVAAIPSFCCCLIGVIALIPGAQRTFRTYGPLGENVGTFPAWYGYICVGAALIPWLLPLIVVIARRRK
jgi:hypothetical protein